MKKIEAVQAILQKQWQAPPKQAKGVGYAPTNIALCKYWGKRDVELNLPITGSLSIALPNKGAFTTLTLHAHPDDKIILNGQPIEASSPFYQRTEAFLALFRPTDAWHVQIDIKMDVPANAGLASSACGFASLVSALNDLLGWELNKRSLSILARLGSGSAARSFWNGFVEWHAGVQSDGMDCYAGPLPFEWPELRIGIVMVDVHEKPISSREAMQQTVNSSVLYANWPRKVAQDLIIMKQGLHTKNFSLLAGAAESNALTMHATMLSSWPPICYFLPDTIAVMQKIWSLRKEGLEIYFTEDAGPNLKLLFLEKNTTQVLAHFPSLDINAVFE